MNEQELIEEIRRMKHSRPALADIKIPIIVEVDNKAHRIEEVILLPPAQVKQIYGEEGHRIIMYVTPTNGAL